MVPKTTNYQGKTTITVNEDTVIKQEGILLNGNNNKNDSDNEQDVNAQLAQALSARRRRDTETKRRRLGLSVNSRESISAAKVRKPVVRRTGLDRFQHATGVFHTAPEMPENTETATNLKLADSTSSKEKKPPGPLTTIPLVSTLSFHDATTNSSDNATSSRLKASKPRFKSNIIAPESTTDLDRKVDLLYRTGGLASTSFSAFQKFEQSSRPPKSFDEREKARKMHAGIELAMRNRVRNTNQNRRKK